MEIYVNVLDSFNNFEVDILKFGTMKYILMKLCLAFVEFYKNGHTVKSDVLTELENYGKYGE